MVKTNTAYHFLHGGGEMGELTRSHDWSNTVLGTPDQWPQSLRTTIGIILSSRYPMFLWWGNDLIQFYNDAYRPSLGNMGKHPTALGQRGVDCWPEIWEIIHPLIQQVRTTGEATWSEDQLVPIYRNGALEDVYWTFSYSAVRAENGNIEGVLVVCTETTNKMVTLKKLETANQQFHNLIMQAPVAIAVFRGPDFVCETANNAYLPIVGKSREEFVGQPLFTSLPETREVLEPIAREVVSSGKPFPASEFELVIHRNGKEETCYFNSIWEPLRENDGSINGFIVVAHEITEHVVARKKLEDSENKVRAIVESAPFPIGVFTGRDMIITLANQSILDTWGKGNDVIGKKYSDILPELDNQQIFDQLDQVFTTGIPFHARNQRVDLMMDGKMESYYFNYSFTPLHNADGSVYGVMNTAANVTDLNQAKQKVEQSERNFRNMVLQAPVAMCILLGPDHVVEVTNEMMLAIWGKPVEDVMHRPIFDGLPDAREQGLEQLLDNVYTTGETFTATERPVVLLRNGKYEAVYQNFVYEPYRDSDGTILGVLAISIDVTEQVIARHKIEEVVANRTKELATANTSLQRSNAELAQFAYIASHDLQEPVRKVSTFAQMLKASLPAIDDRSEKYLEKINTSASRMITLIRDILAYSQLSKENEDFQSVSLPQVMDDIKGDFELLIEQKQAEILYPGLPVIEAIPLQMSQLFSNLISNALKFSRKDTPPRITVTATDLSEEDAAGLSLAGKKKYYNIEFRDNGIGFKPEYATQIFNIFQRLHGKSEIAGTGIGLALCKKIAQNHYGDIYATGSSENGAVINVILPASISN